MNEVAISLSLYIMCPAERVTFRIPCRVCAYRLTDMQTNTGFFVHIMYDVCETLRSPYARTVVLRLLLQISLTCRSQAPFGYKCKKSVVCVVPLAVHSFLRASKDLNFGKR